MRNPSDGPDRDLCKTEHLPDGAVAYAVTAHGNLACDSRLSCPDAFRIDDSQQLPDRSARRAHRLGDGRVGEGIPQSRHHQSDDQHLYLGDYAAVDRLGRRSFLRLVDRANGSTDEGAVGISFLAIVFFTRATPNHGMDSAARSEIRAAESGSASSRAV